MQQVIEGWRRRIVQDNGFCADEASAIRERLVGLAREWRKKAATDRAKSRDINERLRRGEVVNMTASTIGSIEGFVEFTDYREVCADALGQVIGTV